jgi:PAS domain S-box-containing protein
MHAILCAVSEGLLILAPDGRIIEANPAATAILGVSREQLLDQTWLDPRWQITNDDGTPVPPDRPAAAVEATVSPTPERVLGIQCGEAPLRWIRYRSLALDGGEPGSIESVVVAFTDITEQRRLIADLHTSRADLQTILDNVPARITVWRADSTNCFINRAAEVQFGISAARAAGLHEREVVGAARAAGARPYVQAVLTGRRQTRNAIDPQPDGSVRYSQVTYAPRFEGDKVVGYYVLGSDVTDLHHSYERIRELAQRLETVREDERHSIARMLHEGVAQDLAAARMYLEPLRAQPHDGHAAALACSNLNQALRDCIDSLRRGADALRPATLGNLRLADALRAHAQEFGALASLPIDVIEIRPVPPVDEPTRVLFFRAAQEALINAASHAEAGRVQIMLRAESGRLVMDVSDDGIGIPAGAIDRAGSCGLLGIRERFAARGGSMSIEPRVPAGTRLSVSVPCGFAAL